MRIGIDVDILGLSNTYTGIPNYIRYLVEGLTKLELITYQVFLVSRQPVYAENSLPMHVSQAVVRWPFKRGWNSFALPYSAWRLKLDLLHLPAFSTPIFAPCPFVVTVHDLSYLRHPRMLPAGNSGIPLTKVTSCFKENLSTHYTYSICEKGNRRIFPFSQRKNLSHLAWGKPNVQNPAARSCG